MTRTLFAAAALLGLLTTGCGLATENDPAGHGADNPGGQGEGNGSSEGKGKGRLGDLSTAGHDMVGIDAHEGAGGDACNGDDCRESGRGGAAAGGAGAGGGDEGGGNEGGGNEGGNDGEDGAGGGDCNGPEITCYEVSGNPTCSGLGLGEELIRIDPPTSGTHAAGAATFTIAVDGGMLDFSTTVGVDAVILKAGNGAMVCTFDEMVSTATDLAGPVNPNNDKLYDLSHVDFCVD